MTTPLHLVKATLRRDRAFEAVKTLLEAEGPDDAASKGHHLVWSLFADAHDAKRDFLWRRIDARSFLVLTPRLPRLDHPFLEIAAKPFAPRLQTGDRLGFELHANPVIRIERKGRPKKVDVVMHALHGLPADQDRADHRADEVARQGMRWLSWQGKRHGFAVAEGTKADGYETVRIPRRPGNGRRDDDPRFSVMDFSGVLTVSEPERFMAALATGFGSAKAYGCGLMLIRRASSAAGSLDEEAA
jgi:CRISPR system Cascade subunit CasE